jgi:precorrin-3B synthase
MNARPQTRPARRGACPGLSAPMQTGDGLLVRWRPIGAVPLTAFAGLGAAARTHGNGIVEVTARGSIQVRGLSDASAERFAADVAALGIAATDGLPILTDALAGVGAHDIVDARALAEELRRKLEGVPIVQNSRLHCDEPRKGDEAIHSQVSAPGLLRSARNDGLIRAERGLAGRTLPARLGPKVSVVIDGGGVPGLDALAADVRLCAVGRRTDQLVRIGVAGDGASALVLGCVTAADGADAVLRLLDVLAQRGPGARAREILAAEGIGVFRRAIADLLSCRHAWQPTTMRSSEAIGLHPLRDGALACGVGLGFGHADASSLELLAKAATLSGASGICTAPGRALIAIGMTRQASCAFAAEAERLGFIVSPDDPRRHVVACAGAPFCAAAYIPARALAPSIAQAAAEFVRQSFTIHISGCNKGCAHAAPAALTVVGTADGCALVADGSARQAPFAIVSRAELPAAIVRSARSVKRVASHV